MISNLSCIVGTVMVCAGVFFLRGLVLNDNESVSSKEFVRKSVLAFGVIVCGLFLLVGTMYFNGKL